MPEIFILIYVLLQKYVIPLFFAIGLMYMIYGFIRYFITEGYEAEGKEAIIKSCSWYTVAIGLYALVAFMGYLGSLAMTADSPTAPNAEVNTNINRTNAILGVPNVPQGNDE